MSSYNINNLHIFMHTQILCWKNKLCEAIRSKNWDLVTKIQSDMEFVANKVNYEVQMSEPVWG